MFLVFILIVEEALEILGVSAVTYSDANDKCLPSSSQEGNNGNNQTNIIRIHTLIWLLFSVVKSHPTSSRRSNSDEKVKIGQAPKINQAQASAPLSPLSNGVSGKISLRFKRLPRGMKQGFLYKVMEAELKYAASREVFCVSYEGNKKILVLMRGVPGSGKSTLAKVIVGLSDHGVSLSADDYFTDSRGTYRYESDKLSAAHESAKLNCSLALEAGVTPVVIDNTNTQMWEMIPYVQMALNNGYEIRIVEPNTPWKRKPNILAGKNGHGVPFSKIKDMLGRYETGITVSKLVNFSKGSPNSGKGTSAQSVTTSSSKGTWQSSKTAIYFASLWETLPPVTDSGPSVSSGPLNTTKQLPAATAKLSDKLSILKL